MAYEGPKAVFATLVSTGEAGLDDPETTKSTKRGIFRIHTKYITITMDSDTTGEEYELRDVPYVQYFEGGYALHGAYWHDGFGQPKSHGCINLAPEDARRLVKLLGDIKSKVNLLPLNAAPGIPYERPSDERVNAFAQILADHHITVSVRKSRGRDIRAACGQLIVEGQKKSPGRKLAGLM